METAIHDSRFLGKIKLKLKLINNYRMYLGVVYVSEITDNGGRVQRKYLLGQWTANRVTKYNYPGIRRPPQQAWDEQKSFIFGAYIVESYKLSFSLTTKNRRGKQQEISNEATYLQKIVRGKNLQMTKDHLHPKVKMFLGHMIIPEDEGRPCGFTWLKQQNSTINI